MFQSWTCHIVTQTTPVPSITSSSSAFDTVGGAAAVGFSSACPLEIVPEDLASNHGTPASVVSVEGVDRVWRRCGELV